MKSAYRVLFVIGLGFLLACPSLRAESDPLVHSVVKIFVKSRFPNYYQPWQSGTDYSSTGSGCVIAGHRLLTNAHVVSFPVYIEVLKAGDSRKYPATVEYVNDDDELAILKVQDDTFFDDTVPVRYGALPDQRDHLVVYGFPIGGDEMSTTEGVVSRIEMMLFAHSQKENLAIQTDAALNPGNSGGPVFKDGKLVGIAFQSLGNSALAAEKIGYIVAIPIVQRFLADAKRGKMEPTPSLGIRTEKLESPALQAYYKVPKDQTGILITHITENSSVYNTLQAGDVLTTLGGQPVAFDGTVAFGKRGRIKLPYVLTSYRVGEPIKATWIRNGQSMSGTFALRETPYLIPRPNYNVRPTYYIFAGMVFTPLTYNYISTLGAAQKNLAQRGATSQALVLGLSRFMNYYYEGWPSKQHRQIVVLSHVLPAAVNAGYHDLQEKVVEKINGLPITEIQDVVKAFLQPEGAYHVIELSDGEMDDHGTQIVLSAADASQANASLSENFGVTEDRSADLAPDKRDLSPH